MENMTFTYPANQPVLRRVHVGVVGSGDLEILLEPSPDQQAHVSVCTSVDGYGATWRAVLDRFFTRYAPAALLELNDFGATPGMVTLRLQQAVEESQA
jgi:malonate decarboxylase delta subunit